MIETQRKEVSRKILFSEKKFKKLRKNIIEIRPMFYSERDFKKEIILKTALGYNEIMQSANGDYFKDFKVIILPKSFFISEFKRDFPLEEYPPELLGDCFEKMNLFEFINFSIQLKKSGQMKRSSVYVPIGTKTGKEISANGFSPVAFCDVLIGVKFGKFFPKIDNLPIIQCSEAPTIQYHKKKQFFVLKINDL